MKTLAMLFTLESRNTKTGPIPVSTTSNNTCPDACPLRGNGCYAEYGPLGHIWRALSRTKPGKQFKRGRGVVQTLTWPQFLDSVRQLPKGTFWRHNQAGDLPGHGNYIDETAMLELIEANKGRRGFTYTHKPLTPANREIIRLANLRGFTVNLSANNLAHADTLADAGVGPVVTVLPDTVHGNAHLRTPQGRTVAVCPATYRDDVSCASCQLCQRQNRTCIVGFPAHGVSKRRASTIATQE